MIQVQENIDRVVEVENALDYKCWEKEVSALVNI